MQEQKQLLINHLYKIIDNTKLQDVKDIIDALTKISDFKYHASDINNLNILFEKITIFLKNEFNILDIKITEIQNNINILLYEVGNTSLCNYNSKIDINKDITLSISLSYQLSNKFNTIYLESFLNDIAHLISIQSILQELKNSSYVDPLTQLKSRHSLNEEMKEIIPLIVREKMKIGVLLINIDRFRAVNDEHGLEFGDEFLKLYANVIKDTIRTSDIAVRFSGGEFLVLLMNVKDDDIAMQIANTLKEKLSQAYLFSPNGDKFKKTACIGVSIFPEDSCIFNDAVAKSELALSDATDSGRNKVLRFQEDDGAIDFF